MSVTCERIATNRIVVGEHLASLAQTVMAAPTATEPIIVQPLGVGTYRLLAGYSPLIAAQQRGEKAVPAVIKDVDRLEEELIESVLTTLERAEHLWRRWEHDAAEHPAASRAAFAAAEAAAAGLDARGVEAHLQMATGLTPAVRELVRPSPLANRPRLLRELAAIADPEQQQQMADLLVSLLGSQRVLHEVKRPAH